MTLKVMSRRAFSQGKEPSNVSSFPTQFRVRGHETALKSTPSEGRGQQVENVFNLLMFPTPVHIHEWSILAKVMLHYDSAE